MPFGDITHQDEHRWQLRAAEVQTRLLKHAFAAGMPSLTWTIATSGALVGEASSLTPSTERRDAFEAWAKHLAPYGKRWDEHDRLNGGTHLHMTFALPTSRGEVRGAIRADLDPDEETPCP